MPGPQSRGEPSRVSRGTLRSLGCPQFSGLETPAKTSNVGVRRVTLTCCRLHRLQRAVSAQCRALGQARPGQAKNTIHRWRGSTLIGAKTPTLGSLAGRLRTACRGGTGREGMGRQGKGSSSSSSSRVTESKLQCSCLLLVLLRRILSRTLCSHNSPMDRPI